VVGYGHGRSIQQKRVFNASQSRYEVKSQYVGSYDDGINKLLAALRAGRGYPHVIQVYDIGARIMADSGAVVPLEDLARQKGFNLDSLVPQPRNYYTVEGKLYGLPFNSSNPLLYFNMAAFQEVGLAFKPTWSLKDLEEAARKLTKKDASGKTVRYGLSIPIDSWFGSCQDVCVIRNPSGAFPQVRARA
jgi:sn-glycerol 3-phosphate transport system substrate-binding protein